MISTLVRSAVLALCVPAVFAQSSGYDLSAFTAANTITRDVAIIGGGSAGTYSAISLKDKKKSVVVVEIKDRLGGHTETYKDPKTGRGIDMGVIIWHNTSIVTDYFKRFNVSLIVDGSDGAGVQTQATIYDLRTGKAFADPRPNQTAVGAAFQKYTQQLLKYPQLSNGLFLPDPVPDDLVMPFGQFAKKYGIEAAIPTMYQYNAGLGDILTIPTVENMRVWNLGLVSALQGGFLTTARHNNSELYGKAQSELLSTKSLLLRSEVIYSERTSTSGVRLVVSTPSGLKLIRAKKLLITIPPKLDALRPFSLSTQEAQIFKNLSNTGYYTSILRNTGLPDNLSIINLSPDTPYNLPKLPAVYNIGTSIYTPGLALAFYGSPLTNASASAPDKFVLDGITASIKRLQAANPGTFNATTPSFVQYSSHAPFYLQARGEDIKRGFYKKMYALQGGRSTWWTGATWRAQDSSEIWRFSKEVVLPEVLKGL